MCLVGPVSGCYELARRSYRTELYQSQSKNARERQTTYDALTRKVFFLVRNNGVYHIISLVHLIH